MKALLFAVGDSFLDAMCVAIAIVWVAATELIALVFPQKQEV
jgi:hypothetical protein